MMTNMEIIETSTNWLITPVVAEVTKCIVDHAFTLELMDGNGTIYMHVVIENDFSITHDNVSNIVKNNDPLSLGDAMVLLRRNLLSGEIRKDGYLKLRFSDNIGLAVKPNEAYESWQIILDRGERFVCMPGGEVAFWSK